LTVPLQNRVTPLGDLLAASERGLVYGNRGCLHDDQGRIRRTYATRRWIACRLEFRGRRRRRLMAPGRYTELFFLDEATALAAGHRPCAECRREDYVHFRELWSELHSGQGSADAIDDQLHSERLASPRQRRLHETTLGELPDGAFVLQGSTPCLLLGSRLLSWSPGGYEDAGPIEASREVRVITPPSLVELLRRGWRGAVPLIHPSARTARSL